ncbi:hypothetical protein [Rathayibacter sp. Leaf248]|uniref:hypothetical protein n=1 Tax=Rathayibacter sp. Leaf248 TaxID=2876555 RepID=UPI001E5896EB|nr:hypothetical protein [Rathayibacter sp. Leaf248]
MAEPEILVAPDTRAAVYQHLDTHSARTGAPAYGRIPSPRPKIFTRVRPVGGFDEDLVTVVHRVTVEAYASTEDAAMKLALQNDAILLAAGRAGRIGEVTVRRVDVESTPDFLPDPLLPEVARATATYAIAARRTAL